MRLLSALLILALQSSSAHAQFGLLDSLFGRGNDENTTEEVFYQEDRLANAAMMVDFANTPLYLVALFKYRDVAVYEDGRESELTGFGADRLYTQAMFSSIVPGVGGEVKFISNIQQAEVVKEDEEEEYDFNMDWDALAVIEFPSGIAFGRMLPDPEFQALSPHKKAGLKYHAIFACELEEGSSVEDLTMVGRQINHGFSNASFSNETLVETGDAVAEVDLIDYKRIADYQEGDEDSARFRTGKNAARKYFDSAAQTAVDHGMQTAATFKIRQSLIEGSSGWDQVRIHTYPSQSALEAAQADPQTNLHHLEAGVNRANAFQVSPVFVNSLGGNGEVSYLDACTSESKLIEAEEGAYDLSGLCP